MLRIPEIKIPELFLALLLLAELAYGCHLKERSFEHTHAAYPAIVFGSIQNGPDGSHAMANAVGTQILAGCILSASRVYEVPAEAVSGIMSVEGGHIGQEVGPNFNGTYDLGPMQVNSLWVPQLARLWHVDDRTARGWVRDDGCANVYVGAWILKQKILKTGSLYNGIAYYHSATRGFGRPYAKKVVSTMQRKGLSRQRPPP